MTLEQGAVLALASLLFGAGTAWGFAKAQTAQLRRDVNAKHDTRLAEQQAREFEERLARVGIRVNEWEQDMIEMTRTLTELRVAVTGLSGQNGILGEVIKLRNNTHEIRNTLGALTGGLEELRDDVKYLMRRVRGEKEG